MSFICEFCNSSFISKSNLYTHQKRAKKCLVIQTKNIPEFSTQNLFVCNKCNKNFTSKQNLNDHVIRCSYKMELLYKDLEKKYDMLEKISKLQIKEKEKQINYMTDENNRLKLQITDLQERLANIAEIGANKNTNTTNTYKVNNNNNNIINLVPYDLDKNIITSIVDEKFNENYLYAKENGIANFALNNLLKDEDGNFKMTCTDQSRKIFVYKDKNGNLYKDINANIFLENYMPAVKKKSSEIISDKEGDEMLELTECMMCIYTPNITHKLAGKLLAQPKAIV
jgi:regulator of replication initiation timing